MAVELPSMQKGWPYSRSALFYLQLELVPVGAAFTPIGVVMIKPAPSGIFGI